LSQSGGPYSLLGQILLASVAQRLAPGGLEPDFVTDQIGQGESVKMAQEGFDTVRENMAEAANGADDTAVASRVKTFDKGTVIFKGPDDPTDIDAFGGLVEQQPAAATADAVDKSLGDQSLGNLHQMVFRYAILPGDFGDRMMAIIGGQIHQGAERIIGVDG
tara:strand:+ start:47 stop:532 length:486 start_codon:yes stop_codon:yes gene_type:complete